MKQLKKLRDLSGLTQTQLSRLAGIDRARLSLAESGQVKLSDTEVVMVRSVLIGEMQKRAERIQNELERNGQRAEEAVAV
jgi:transcriptional regulator with XRE-family HTH domain